MVVKIKETSANLSISLKKKLPSLELDGFLKIFGIPFGLGLSFFGLVYYGGIAEPNGFRYLLVPIVCPMFPTLYFMIFSHNPYHGSSLFVSSKMRGLDLIDLDAQRSVEIYRSTAARRFLVFSYLEISGVIVAVMVVITVFRWHSVEWKFDITAPVMESAIVCCVIGS